MAIRDRDPREQATLHFKAAGLGARSAVEAARLLFEAGVSFETAAVLGQRAGEPAAPVQKIREEADRYRGVGSVKPSTTAWGRAVRESDAADVSPKPSPSYSASEAKQVVDPERTTQINGIEHYVVHEYTPVTNTEPSALSEAGPRRSAWGRERSD